MDSILTSIKKLLGIPEEYEQFDADITMHINSVFMILNQLGVGPKDGFSIKDKTTTWNEFVAESDNLEAVRSYVYMKVTDAINRNISELEWRLNVAVDK